MRKKKKGSPPDGPTFLGSDNFANALVASTWGSATKSKHFIRRYWLVVQRVKSGDLIVGHVPDTENAADFLTKWVGKEKLAKSLRYLTNEKAIVGATPAVDPG